MQKQVTNAILSTWIKILQCDMNTLYRILSDIFLFYIFQPLRNLIHTKHNNNTSIKQSNAAKEQNQEKLLSREDIKVVMERLGIICYPDEGSNKFQERYDANEISGLFEEEPSLEELKEAFDIFDYNKDGLIDEKDLQRVLYCLYFTSEEWQMEKCREMIKAAKKDGDPTIDFNEFVRFMEKCFC